jgi:hypothetical protein
MSPSKGRFAITVSADTQINEKGVKGRVTLKNGDHVGVHGFVRGRAITAITVRIYPSHVKPKPYSLRGTLTSVSGGMITILVHGRTAVARTTSTTTVTRGSAPDRVSDLHSGQSVLVRLVPGKPVPRVDHVHIYGATVPKRRVQFDGTIVSVGAGSFVLAMGTTRSTIRDGQGLKVYLGTVRAGVAALQPGRKARVYACCVGTPPVATSIHVTASHATPTSILLRGSVTARTTSGLTLTGGGKVTAVSFDRSTRFEIGAGPTGAGGVRVGDYVSVRGVPHGRALIASRVHVYLAYRKSYTISGTATAVGPRTITVDSRGRRVVIGLPARVPVRRARTTIPLSAIHTGDAVTVSARLTAPGTYVASSVVVAIPPVQTVTVSGIVVSTSASTVQIAPAHGPHVQVFLGDHTARLTSGTAAPQDALFPGVHVRIRAVRQGKRLQATSVSVTLAVRDLSGRVDSISATVLILRTGSATRARLMVAPALRVTDSGKVVGRSGLRPGAFVSAHIYEADSHTMRVVALAILHPALDFSAIVVGVHTPMTVGTTAGDRYALTIPHGVTVRTVRTELPVGHDEIPLGARVHVTGVARTDGRIQVSSLTVTLSSVSVRGTVTALNGRMMTVLGADGTTIAARTVGVTRVTQGASTLLLTDIVAGDDITVDGYTVRGGVLVRAIAVHRRLVGLSGTISSNTDVGFTLTAAAGDHPVIVFTTTVFTGFTGPDEVVPGTAVHVTGYMRGDGAILATRVRKGR